MKRRSFLRSICGAVVASAISLKLTAEALPKLEAPTPFEPKNYMGEWRWVRIPNPSSELFEESPTGYFSGEIDEAFSFAPDRYVFLHDGAR
jgi:hypothetical protein